MPNNDAAANFIVLKRGSIYLSAYIYKTYFAGLDAVILLDRDSHLFIMPVRNASGGGYLLKLRNPAGDRIINAMDFFRERNLDDFAERKIDIAWDQDMAAIRAEKLFIDAN